jgi:acetyl-CoA C-acetyltransferase
MQAERVPVVVGVGQVVERGELTSAVQLAARAAEVAFADAPGLREKIEQLTLVAVSFSPAPPDAASQVARELGLGAQVQRRITTPGGNSPQWLVNEVASAIAAGQLSAALVAGAEATRSMRKRDPRASFLSTGGSAGDAGAADPVVGASLSGMLGPAERAAGLSVPAEVYPMLECARAHAEGRSLVEQRARLARLMERFSACASRNPHAWFERAWSAAEIGTPGADNRLTAEPYTKRMNSFPDVDQASALIVTSLALARALRLEQRAVYVWSGASCAEPPPAQRPEPGTAPALRAAARAALDAAGIGADALRFIDCYSCFPIAVEAGADALGTDIDDPRGLTVTGGMPFFGGPGNNYSGHAIAELVACLREAPGLGYVNANGGFLSKHSTGVYGSEPPPRGFQRADTRAAQAAIDAAARPVRTDFRGDARVVAGSVVYDRSGNVTRAPVIAELPDGSRVAAQASPAALEKLAGRNLVGERVRVDASLYKLWGRCAGRPA